MRFCRQVPWPVFQRDWTATGSPHPIPFQGNLVLVLCQLSKRQTSGFYFRRTFRGTLSAEGETYQRLMADSENLLWPLVSGRTVRRRFRLQPFASDFSSSGFAPVDAFTTHGRPVRRRTPSQVETAVALDRLRMDVLEGVPRLPTTTLVAHTAAVIDRFELAPSERDDTRQRNRLDSLQPAYTLLRAGFSEETGHAHSPIRTARFRPGNARIHGFPRHLGVLRRTRRFRDATDRK